MAFQSVPGGVEVQWRFMLFSQPCQIRIGVDVGGSPSQATTDSLAVAAWDAWDVLMKPVSSNSLLLVETYARDLEDSPGFETQYVDPGGAAQGSVGILVEDSQSCCIINFGSGQTGRSTRGRIFYPAINTGNTVDGQFGTVQAAAYLNAFIDMVAATVTGIGVHAVVSRITGGAVRPTGVLFEVLDYASTTLIGSQRNRRPGL